MHYHKYQPYRDLFPVALFFSQLNQYSLADNFLEMVYSLNSLVQFMGVNTDSQ